MTATVKPASSPLLAKRLERLRFQIVASDAARVLARQIGANIRFARIEKGLNGRELAEEIKKKDPARAPTPQRVSDWERGVQKPDDRYMRTLSGLLGHPISWFYTNHEEAAEVTPEPFNGPTVADLDRRLSHIEDQLQELLGRKPQPVELTERTAEEALDYLKEATGVMQSVLGQLGRDVGRRDSQRPPKADRSQSTRPAAA